MNKYSIIIAALAMITMVQCRPSIQFTDPNNSNSSISSDQLLIEDSTTSMLVKPIEILSLLTSNDGENLTMNEIYNENIKKCHQIQLSFGQNLSICNVLPNIEFPYGCFQLKFSFGLKSMFCFIPKNYNNTGKRRKDVEEVMILKRIRNEGSCVGVDGRIYNLLGTFCLTYSWNISPFY